MLSIYSSPATVPVVKGGYFVPRHNTKITQDKIIYELGLPGFTKEDVQVNVTGDSLNISSETRKDYIGYVSCPVRVAPFSVSFTIPSQSEVESASMSNGLLTVIVRTQSVKTVTVT
jgi:HSP20 family molecular chaperone IbpA